MRAVNIRVLNEPQTAFLRISEQREFNSAVKGTGGALSNLGNGAPNALAGFMAATPATGTANTWTTISGVSAYQPTPGFALVFSKIRVWVNKDCMVGLQRTVTFGGASTNYYGATTSIVKTEVMKEMADYQPSTTGGWVEFNFGENSPLVVRSYERLDFTYSRTDTAGVAGAVFPTGFEIVDDFNFSAPQNLLVIGDSIGGITNVYYVGEDYYWTHNIRNKYLAAGRNIHLINICVGGTTISDWEYMLKNGRLNGMKYDAVIINAGVNDSVGGATNLSSGGANTGSDGKFKLAYKSVIRRLGLQGKTMPIIVNGITPVNLSTVVNNVANYRTEQQGIVADMIVEGYTGCKYVNNSALWTNTDTTKFQETGANLGLHPNDASQKVLADNVWSTTMQNLVF